jgi:hypothetical protein
MGRNISNVSSCVANAFANVRRFDPVSECNKDVFTFTVPAGVSTLYATGVAQGGSNTFDGISSYSSAFTSGAAIFNGVSLCSFTNNATSVYNTPSPFCTEFATSVRRNASNGGGYSNQYMAGTALAVAPSGAPFMLCGGGQSDQTMSYLMMSLDNGATWTSTTQSCSNGAATGYAMRQIAVDGSGNAVAMGVSSGTPTGDSVSMLCWVTNYGAAGGGRTAQQLFGVSANADPNTATVRHVNGNFVVAKGYSGATTVPFSYCAASALSVGTWTTANVFGGTATGTDVAWTGSNYVWVSANGLVYTSSSISGPYTSRTTVGSSNLNVVSDGAGNVVVYTPGNTGSTSFCKYSTDHGLTWNTCAPLPSNIIAGWDVMVWDGVLGQFFVFSSTSGVAARSPTGATWTALSTLDRAYGLTTGASLYQKSVYAGRGVVTYAYNVSSAGVFNSASQTATVALSQTRRVLSSWQPAPFLAVGSFYYGADLIIYGSSSGELLRLKGGRGAYSQTGTWAGGEGGSISGAILGGQSTAAQGGFGMRGMGGSSSNSVTGAPVMLGGTNAGNGGYVAIIGNNYAGGGGGTVMIYELQTTQAVNVRVPGGGGGFSGYGSSHGFGGGGGSMYARGADGVGQYNLGSGIESQYGVGASSGYATGSNVFRTGGGGEGGYRMQLAVVPGETLTLTVPTSGYRYHTTDPALFGPGRAGGSGLLLLEWN